MTALRAAALATLVLTLAGGAEAATRRAPAAPAPPAAVKAMARQMLALDFDDASLPRDLPSRMFHAVNITADGVPDWRVDAREMGPACGPGPCPQLIIVSRPGRTWTLAFQQPALRLVVTGAGAAAVVDVTEPGQACRDSSGPCVRRYGWDARLVRFVERPNGRGDAYLVGPLMPVSPLEAQLAPPDVALAIAALGRDCRRAGGLAPDFTRSVTTTPDLNGDGVRDWIVGSGYDTCADGRTVLPLQVLASAANGRFRLAYSRTGVGYDIDLGTRPAAFVEREDDGSCGQDDKSPCFEDVLLWEPRQGRLVPGVAGMQRAQERAEAARRDAEFARRQADLANQSAYDEAQRRQAITEALAIELARRAAEASRGHDGPDWAWGRDRRRGHGPGSSDDRGQGQGPQRPDRAGNGQGGNPQGQGGQGQPGRGPGNQGNQGQGGQGQPGRGPGQNGQGQNGQGQGSQNQGGQGQGGQGQGGQGQGGQGQPGRGQGQNGQGQNGQGQNGQGQNGQGQNGQGQNGQGQNGQGQNGQGQNGQGQNGQGQNGQGQNGQGQGGQGPASGAAAAAAAAEAERQRQAQLAQQEAARQAELARQQQAQQQQAQQAAAQAEAARQAEIARQAEAAAAAQRQADAQRAAERQAEAQRQAEAAAQARAAERADDAAWANARGGDRGALQGYLGAYPNGEHADEARAAIAALPSEQPAAAPEPPAPAPAAEPPRERGRDLE